MSLKSGDYIADNGGNYQQKNSEYQRKNSGTISRTCG
jgi:hypothetical protein